jgi:hypothetical protein
VICDDVLSALELGDAGRQREARRHAAGCPACAVAMRRWLALKADLVEVSQLTERERAIWHSQAVVIPRKRRLLVGAGVGAAVAAGVLGLLLTSRPSPAPAPGPAPGPPVESQTFSPERAAREFANFDRQLDQFDNELTAISKHIALAEAKREAAELSDRYR